jgi:hypothetical protein
VLPPKSLPPKSMFTILSFYEDLLMFASSQADGGSIEAPN